MLTYHAAYIVRLIIALWLLSIAWNALNLVITGSIPGFSLFYLYTLSFYRGFIYVVGKKIVFFASQPWKPNDLRRANVVFGTRTSGARERGRAPCNPSLQPCSCNPLPATPSCNALQPLPATPKLLPATPKLLPATPKGCVKPVTHATRSRNLFLAV